jgi:peptidoglycan/LPS O-acetylase OafA/YrhL
MRTLSEAGPRTDVSRSEAIGRRGADPTGADAAGPAGTPAGVAPARPPRILALDLFRVLVVASVVAVHTLSESVETTAPTGAFITVFHTSRELFFLLTAFVLSYNYADRAKLSWPRFWRRRYALVVPAYIAWSLIYFLADPGQLDPVTGALLHFGGDLLTGSARYQLYFLLVTMQLYLAFPLLRWLLRKTAGHHLALFAVAAAYQLALTLAIQHHLVRTGLIGAWLRYPDAWLTSYLFYLVAGAIAARHFERLARLCRRHATLAGPVFALGLCAGLGSYAAGIAVAGQSPSSASAVFQPAVIAETLCFGWALLTLSLRWADRGARHRSVVSAGADGSFGIFLAHPLVLQGLLALAGATGLLAALQAAPACVQLVALLGVGVPLIYGLTGLLVAVVRRTPLSLPLTGRRVRATTVRWLRLRSANSTD